MSISEFTELRDGWFNATYLVTLDTGTRTVLKVAPPTIIPKAPDTGFGTGDSGSGFPFLWIFAGIALVSVAGASTVAVRRRR